MRRRRTGRLGRGLLVALAVAAAALRGSAAQPDGVAINRLEMQSLIEQMRMLEDGGGQPPPAVQPAHEPAVQPRSTATRERPGAARGEERRSVKSTPRNVILFVPDGLGPAWTTLAREVLAHRAGEAGAAPPTLNLDALAAGTVTTKSASSLVTDSAAAGTAFATGYRTNNGQVSWRQEGGDGRDAKQMGSLVEGAQLAGMRTGLVTNTEVTSATPAAFAAHVASRSADEQIGRQLMRSGLDVLFGGGAGKVSRDKWPGTTVTTRDELMGLRAGDLPVLGTFDDGHLKYAIDRYEGIDEPSLREMAMAAVLLLDAAPASDPGFFLMVECGRIDHAGHTNDAAAALGETLACDEAVGALREFAEADGDTLLFGMADHETGGLSVGCCDEYSANAPALAQLSASFNSMVYGALHKLNERLGSTGADALPEVTVEVFERELQDRWVPMDQVRADPAADWEGVRQVLRDLGRDVASGALPDVWAGANRVEKPLSRAVSAALRVGWTTYGHTGTDVTLYAAGPSSEKLRGTLENIDVSAVTRCCGTDTGTDTCLRRDDRPRDGETDSFVRSDAMSSMSSGSTPRPDSSPSTATTWPTTCCRRRRPRRGRGSEGPGRGGGGGHGASHSLALPQAPTARCSAAPSP